ncbi:MAG TPA: LPP20 family lipoprotein [Salinivirgaceae bacterium]|mgnify:CR=1 FL=1|nr:LPP20 family lipoprotein [Salinivirgaceae bacterium]
MKKLILLVTVISIYGCQQAQENSATFPPQWTKTLPQSEKLLFATGYGKSVSEEIALEKARLQAFTELAKKISEVQTETQGNITKTTVEATLKEVNMVEKAIFQDSAGYFEVYLLVSHPKPSK